MARISGVYSLPEAVRDELRNRLLDPASGTYDEHTAWLKEQGCPVSRSSIARYGMTLQLSRDTDLLLRCFDIASRYSDADTIIANGKALLKALKSMTKPPQE